MRRPSPHLTTALATTKATTTSSTLEFAKPAKALTGSRVPDNTAAATASRAAVRSGKAFRMTATMADAKMANSCHASIVRPAGTGVNQRPSCERKRQGLLEPRATAVGGGIHGSPCPADAERRA